MINSEKFKRRITSLRQNNNKGWFNKMKQREHCAHTARRQLHAGLVIFLVILLITGMMPDIGTAYACVTPAPKECTSSANTISIPVTKVWDDNNNAAKTRPKSVTVRLLANGTATGKTLTLSSRNGWKDSFDGLSPYDQDGNKINYTVSEDSVSNYSTSIEDGASTDKVTKGTTIWIGKDSPCDTTTKSYTNCNFLVIKKGNSYLIWTPSRLNCKQQNALKQYIFSTNKVAGFRTDRVYGFVSGSKYNWWYGYYDYISFTNNGNGCDVYFSNHRDWNHVYPGYITWDDDIAIPQTITNTLNTGSLKVSKTVVNGTDADNNTLFDFTVKQTSAGDQLNGTYGKMKFENGKATFQLKHGEAISASNLPAGMKFKVWETGNKDFTTTLEENGEKKNDSLTEFTVGDGQTTQLDYFNTKITPASSLTISKNVVNGNDADNTKDFAFTLKISNPNISGTYNTVDSDGNQGTLTFNEDSEASFSLKHGESLKVEGLPAGAGYNVSEASDEDFTTTVKNNNSTGVITKDKNETVDFVNTRKPKKITVNIPIGKTVLQGGDVAPGAKTFNFLVSGVSENADLTGLMITGTSISTEGAKDSAYTGQISITGTEEAFKNAGTLKITEVNDNADNWTYSNAEYQVSPSGAITMVKDDQGNLVNSTAESADFTNTFTKNTTTSVSVSKVWSDSDNQYKTRPDSITVNLLANGTKVDSKTVMAKDGWKCTFSDLPKKTEDGKTIAYTVTEDSISNYTSEVTGSAASGFTITNTSTYTPPAPTPTYTTFTVNKVWNLQAGQKAADSVDVQLYKNGELYDTESVTASQGWTYTWVNLPASENGSTVNWTVQEVNPNNAYQVSILSGTNKATITNTPNALSPGATQVTVNKVWKLDNGGTAADSVQAQLYQNGTAYGDPVTLSEGTNWAHTWENLPKADTSGNEYTWTVQEVNVPNGFTSSVTGEDNTFTITNDDNPTTPDPKPNSEPQPDPEPATVNISIPITKIVEKGEGGTEEPEAKDFTFTAAGDITGQATISTDGTGSYPGSIVTQVNKDDLTKPLTCTIRESNDGASNWSYSDKVYTATVATDGTVSVTDESGSPALTASFTNTFTKSSSNPDNPNNPVNPDNPVTPVNPDPTPTPTPTPTPDPTPVPTPTYTTFTVNKVWNLQAGQTAADSVDVQLYKNGELYDTESVTASQGWTYTWAGLPAEENGSTVNWTVQEVNPNNTYVVSILNGPNSATITNTPNALSPSTAQVTVNKVWKLDNGGKAASSVQAQLYRNGEAYGSPVKLSAATNWTYTWKKLPKAAKDGTEYVWTVKEVNVPDGFTSSVSIAAAHSRLRTTTSTSR